ncbi:smoothelin-like [Acropora millepora]|uniref:smoothelin-like n=1 Tax=Acropora millepora TaxID=45264 RepID=UPI001CF10592|nr:smoothelin-like [Acropora millepora]
MADEEAVLKKKLEDTTDFDERRAIRQQLRELRKKKLDALESSPSMTDRPRRRERVRKEEQITVTTETNTVDGYSSEQKTQTKIETNHKCEVITDGLAENDKNGLIGNGIENGNQDTTSAVTDVSQNENEVKHDIKINRDEKPLDSELEEVVSVAQELPKENEMAINESSETSDKELEKPEEEETEEVELTPEVVEKIEDIDMLEKLLKEVPLNEYALRKAIRLQIRQLRVKRETSMENENVLILGKGTKAKNSMNLPGNDSNNNRTPTRNCKPSDNEEIEANPLESAFVNSETTVIGSKELAAAKEIQTNGEHLCGSEKSESDCEADETLSMQSSLTPDVNLKPDLPKKIPPIPPRPSTTSSTSSKGELMGDFKGRILGKSATPPPRDLTRKLKSQPEQVDFRGQLKKTGLRADKDLTVQGKRKQQLQEGNFHGQLKSTGGDTSRNLSAVQSVGKKKDSLAQFDFRGQLQRTSDEQQTKKTPPTRPPPTYLNRETERGASSEKAKPHSEGDVKPAETSTKDVRKISSADLFNMLSKPVENSGEGYLVQRGLKKAEASKANPQKFKSVSVDTSLEDENFKARMAQRKERSDKQFYSGKGSKDERKMSAGVETKDFKAILKKAGAKQSRAIESSTGQVTKEQPTSNNAGKRSENVTFDVKQREQKDKGIVERTTEKQVTEVEQLDGAQVTTQTAKTTEVHKTAGGTTMTVTKTTRTTEVQKAAPGKGTSIEAMLAQKRREKIMAKKQHQADTRNKRMAFKEKLEAQSPKVEGGGRNFQSGNSAINSLQEWCRRRTKYHEGVDIQNFTTSWANGLAMCALLNYYLPEKIQFETLNPSDKKGNWSLAFKVANEEGIEPLLELEDILAVDVPEPKSLITYVHFIYQHFSDKQQK